MTQQAYLFLIMYIVIALLLFYFLPVSQGAVENGDGTKNATNEMAIVEISHGKLQGGAGHSFFHSRPYLQFLGIPYAVPPLGPLRFGRPRPFEKAWRPGVREARLTPAVCVQPNLFGDNKDKEPTVGQEDCLVLNVYKPVSSCSPASPCPVLVWFHPGGFAMLDGSPYTFGPQLWMDQDVVMVSVNYRLGVLGFLSLDNEVVPGNMGLRDQSLALDWVQKEILHFGGDPSSVTLMGSNAGGYSALLQMLSPINRGRGRFHKVISQSGTPVFDPMIRFAKPRREYALRVAKEVGCEDKVDKKLLACLRSTSADLLQKQLDLFSESKHSHLPNPFVPQIDRNYTKEPFLPDYPETMIRNKDFEPVPVLIGSNSQEGILHMSQFLAHPGLFKNFTESLPLLLLNRAQGEVTEEDTRLVEDVKRLYLRGRNSHTLNMKHGIRLFTHFGFQGKTGSTVKLLAENSDQPVYHYLYKYLGTHSFGDLYFYSAWKIKFKMFLHSYGIGTNMRNGYGSCQGDELLLLFTMGHLPPPMGRGPLSARDQLTAKQIVQKWTDFARFGRPSTAERGQQQDNFEWKPSQRPDYRFATITSHFEMTTDPEYWANVRVYERFFGLANGLKVEAKQEEEEKQAQENQDKSNKKMSGKTDL